MDQLKLNGFPQFEEDRRREWLSERDPSIHSALAHTSRRQYGSDYEGLPSIKISSKESSFFAVILPQKTSVSSANAPSAYSFNHEIIPDVLYVTDMVRQTSGFLSTMCNGVTFHAMAMMCTGTGSPASKKCWDKFLSRWTMWAGITQIVITDRVFHNRGIFARGLKSNAKKAGWPRAEC